MSTEDTAAPRPGSSVDLARRMEKIEGRYEELAGQVTSLASTVARVEQNQEHATELNKLRFDSLDSGLKLLQTDLKGFMARIEGVITGEISTAQTRAGQELVADYQKWRAEVDEDRDAQAIRNGRMDLIGRLAVLLTIGGGVTTLCSVVALVVTLSHA